MKSKKEYLILAGVIVVLVAYLLVHKTNRTHYSLPEMPNLKTSELTAVKISATDKTMELKKKDDGWVLEPEKYPADSEKVDSILKAIADLRLTALSSESKNFDIYDLDADHKILVQAWAGDKLVRAFDIGKTAPSYRHTFIKLPDDDRVYHAADNFRNKFEKTKDEIRDKTVLDLDKASIQQIQIARKDGPSLIVSKKPVSASQEQSKEEKPKKPLQKTEPETIWQDAEGKPVVKVDELLDAVVRLKCESYIDDKTKEGLGDPVFTLTLSGDQTATLSIFKQTGPNDEAYPAVSSQNAYPFLLPKYKAERILKAFDNKEEKQSETPDR